jgi:hypothetical protein
MAIKTEFGAVLALQPGARAFRTALTPADAKAGRPHERAHAASSRKRVNMVQSLSM